MGLLSRIAGVLSPSKHVDNIIQWSGEACAAAAMRAPNDDMHEWLAHALLQWRLAERKRGVHRSIATADLLHDTYLAATLPPPHCTTWFTITLVTAEYKGLIDSHPRLASEGIDLSRRIAARGARDALAAYHELNPRMVAWQDGGKLQFSKLADDDETPNVLQSAMLALEAADRTRRG